MKLKKDYWVAIVCKILVIITELLITVFINRSLSIELKGEYSYILKIVEIFYIIFSIGIGQAYSTFKRQYGYEVRDTFIFLSFFHGILTLGLGYILVYFLKLDYGSVIVFLSAIAVVKVIVSMIAVIDRSITRNIMQAGINLIHMVLLGLVYVYNIGSLSNVIFCYAIIDITRIGILMYVYKMNPFSKNIKKNLLKSIYKSGFVTMIVMLLITVNYSIDTIMLREISNSYYVGIYSVGASLSNMFLLIPDAFKEVLFGDSTNKNFSNTTAFTAIKVSLVFSVLIFVALIFFGKYGIVLLYGANYLPSYEVTLVLFIGCFSLIFFKVLQPIYISHGKQNRALAFLLISAILNIGLNYFFIPKYNSIGAAFASAVSYTICGLLFLIDYKKKNYFY